MPCSIPVYVPRTSRRPKPNSRRSQDRVVLCSCLRPRTSRRPKPNSRRSQDRVVLCSCLRPKNVTSAQAEQSSVPRPCRALFLSTSQERHVGPSRTVVGPKTMSCSVPVYVPRSSRRPKPNSRRSQDRAMLYSRLRTENVTSAQAEQSPVPRPCHTLFTSTSRERHVGPSRAVASPKTVPCSVSIYVPRTSPAQSPVPRQCLALFPSTTRERHVGPSRTVTGPKTVPYSIHVDVPRTSRRPSRTVAGPKPGRAPCPSTSQERHVGPSRIGTGPKTVVLCSVYIPRTSRWPKPNSHRSQDRAMLYSRLRPENVTSAQAEQSSVPRSCRALFLFTSQDRHVGPSRTVTGPKTMPCSIHVDVPRTSRRPKPSSRQSQDRVVLCFRLRPENVPPHSHRSQDRALLCFRLRPENATLAQPCSHRPQDRVVLCARLRPENVTSAQAEQSPVPRPYRALFPSTSRERPAGPTEPESVPGPKVLCARLHPASFASAPPPRRPSQDRAALCARPRKNVTPAQAEQAARTHAVPCSGPVTPQPSRRPNPKRRRSQDRTVLRFLLFPKTVTSG